MSARGWVSERDAVATSHAGIDDTGERRERVRSLLAWAAERFPLKNAVFFLVLYLTSLVVGRGSAGAGPVPIGWHDVPGFIAFWAFFLVLRVLDEHKDFDADTVAHPDRVLQRGRVSLRELRGIGYLAGVTTLATTLWLDGGVGRATTWWLAVACWSALMAREFFVRDWLRERLIPYALSHMCVMPLVIGWAMAMAGAVPTASLATKAMMALAFMSGLAFEMARKVRAPADERPRADSYTSALGVMGATRSLVAVTLSATIIAVEVVRLSIGELPAWVAVAGAVAAALATFAVLGFRREPTSRHARAVEGSVGVAMLIVHLAIITAIAATRGLELP